MKPSLTYYELKNIIRFYSELVNASNLAHSEKSILLSIEARTSIGCLLLDQKLDDMDRHTTNRYFLDSIGVTKIDKKKKINLAQNFKKLFPDLNLSKVDAETLCINHLKRKYEHSLQKVLFYKKQLWNNESRSFFEKNGFIIFENVFSKIEAKKYRDEIYRLAEQDRLQKSAYFYGFNNELQRVYNLINKTDAFDGLITNSLATSIMDDLFERNNPHQKYVMASWHANIINPGGKAQIVHIDAAVPEPIPPWIIRANINYLTEDYTIKNGATICLPGSHKFLKKPTKKDINSHQSKFISLVAPAGSIVVWHGHLWHCSGENNSKEPRAGLLACYAASHLLEMSLEENHPLIINKNRQNQMSEDLKNLFSLNHGIKPGAMDI